jgi:hypothetical protein
MSLASELLQSTSKRRNTDGFSGSLACPIRRLSALNHIVYGLMSEHMNSDYAGAHLQTDLKIMLLSGMINKQCGQNITQVCREASSVMYELASILNDTRPSRNG